MVYVFSPFNSHIAFLSIEPRTNLMVSAFLRLFNSRIAFLSTVDMTKNDVFSHSNLAKLPYSCPYLCLSCHMFKSSTYDVTDAFGKK